MYHSFLIHSSADGHPGCFHVLAIINSEKEEWSWRNQPSWIQILLQSCSHQDSMVLAQKQKYRWMEQYRKPSDNPIYGQLIFDKEGKNTQWVKDSLFYKWCCENWIATYKRMKLEHFLTLYTKMKSKWIKYLIIRSQIIEFLEENIGRTRYDIIIERSSMTHLLE